MALAPILEAVSQRMIEAGTSGQGMGVKVIAVVEGMAKGIGKLADLVHHFQGAWMVLKTVLLGVASVWTTIINEMGKKLEGLINLIPGIEVNFSATTSAIDDMIKNELSKTWDGLMDHLDAPLPSEGVDKFFKDVEKRANEAAKKVAADRATALNPALIDPSTLGASAKADKKDKTTKPSTVMSFLGGSGINSATAMIGKASTSTPNQTPEATELKKQTPLLKSIEQGIQKMLSGESVVGAV